MDNIKGSWAKVMFEQIITGHNPTNPILNIIHIQFYTGVVLEQVYNVDFNLGERRRYKKLVYKNEWVNKNNFFLNCNYSHN